MKKIELWADSFHEGDWACGHLSKFHQDAGFKASKEYLKGFIPVYRFEFLEISLEITVYGAYNSWSPMPEEIKKLIEWGKPDFLAYDPETKEILFAVEETAAIPTGNQALQRCERQYGASRAKIPYWYLLAEYGTHKDEGVRRDSIWPTIMAIKLSLFNKTPSVIVHYADKENPEGYDFGNGVNSLFTALYKMLNNFVLNKPVLNEIQPILKDHYSDMFRFLISQHKNIIKHLPGQEEFNNSELLDILVNTSINKLGFDKDKFREKYPKFLYWPSTLDWYKDGGDKVSSSSLIKHDNFAFQLEQSIDLGYSYVISSNAGSKPQKKQSVVEWLDKQKKSFDKAAKSKKLDVSFNIQIKDFPLSDKGNLHLTTAKNIIYFFDSFKQLKKIINAVMPRTSNLIEEYDENKKALVYLSNSIKPGRIFGDPFTGQISAYATSFGKLDSPSRIMIAYFPHQSFSQFIDSPERLVTNKGFVLMRELIDFVILAGGIIVKFNKDGRAEAF